MMEHRALEFIELCINQYLYTRKVYPASIFTPIQKYGIRVYISRHPDLKSYIHECCKSLLPLANVFEKLVISDARKDQLVIEWKNLLLNADTFTSDFASSLVLLQSRSPGGTTNEDVNHDSPFTIYVYTMEEKNSVVWNSDSCIWVPDNQDSNDDDDDTTVVVYPISCFKNFQLYYNAKARPTGKNV